MFIPAGTGKDLEIPAALTGADSLTTLYTGGTLLQKKHGTGKLGLILQGLPMQFKENTSRRFLCPEIEVASGDQSYVREAMQRWLGRCVRDGSLPSTGFEINTMPSQGDMYLKMVEYVCKKAEEAKCTVTKACGLHVHVDSRDFDYMDLRKFVFLYELCEPAMFSLLPPERHGNRFCLPCGSLYSKHLRAGEVLTQDKVAAENKKKPDLKKGVVDMVFGKDGKVQVGGKYAQGAAHEVRYRAANLYSHYYRGSIEFRHAPGSIDAEYINNWSLLCSGIVDAAFKLSEKNILSLNKRLTATATVGDLYGTVFTTKGQLWNTQKASLVLEASTEVLKSVVQDRVVSFIDELQEQVSAVGKKKEEPPSGGSDGGPNIGTLWSPLRSNLRSNNAYITGIGS